MDKDKAYRFNTTALAYLGDAVFELAIRERIIEKNPHSAGKAHQKAIKYVSAEGQSKVARKMMAESFLTEEEINLLKRARNHRTISKPSSADPRDYKVATGLEALFGYLQLIGTQERIEEIADKAIEIVEEA